MSAGSNPVSRLNNSFGEPDLSSSQEGNGFLRACSFFKHIPMVLAKSSSISNHFTCETACTLGCTAAVTLSCGCSLGNGNKVLATYEKGFFISLACSATEF